MYHPISCLDVSNHYHNVLVQEYFAVFYIDRNLLTFQSGIDILAVQLDNLGSHKGKAVRKANIAEIPRFIGIGPDYKAMMLALMLMLPEVTRARRFL